MPPAKKIKPEAQNELIQLLSKQATLGEGLTTPEIAEEIGMSEQWVGRYLRKLGRKGQLKMNKKLMLAIDGRMVPVPCYVLLSK